MFVDQVTIEVWGGAGGAGAEAFRRERGVPHGGPSGGDGGAGGNVILVADPEFDTLLDYRYRGHYEAERGQHGQGKDRTGRSGEDLVLGVPPGTLVRDEDDGEVLGELLEPGERLVVARGGRGGRGTGKRATPTRQAPTGWDPGEEGEHRRLQLELKLIADVGLVGEPNAGKSTFLATVSAARPKVAGYPFTTVNPTLGVASLQGFRSMVLADIPGIIEGAHEGRGLGLRFLQHVERTRVLAFLVPLDDPDPQEAYRRLRRELASFSSELAAKRHRVFLTKTDLLGPGDDPPVLEAPEADGVDGLSSVSGQGIEPALERLWDSLQAARDEEEPPDEERAADARSPGGEARAESPAGETGQRGRAGGSEAGPADWPDEWEEGWTEEE